MKINAKIDNIKININKVKILILMIINYAVQNKIKIN